MGFDADVELGGVAQLPSLHVLPSWFLLLLLSRSYFCDSFWQDHGQKVCI